MSIQVIQVFEFRTNQNVTINITIKSIEIEKYIQFPETQSPDGCACEDESSTNAFVVPS
jgi:hypothetical protein